jgi:hypothetical protein
VINPDFLLPNMITIYQDIMIFFIPEGGLANRMRAMDSALSLCYASKIKLRVYWVKESGLNCPFYELFKPIKGVDVIDSEKIPFIFLKGAKLNLYLPEIFRKTLKIDYFDSEYMSLVKKKRYDVRQFTNNWLTLISSYSRFYPTNTMFKLFSPIDILKEKIHLETIDFNDYTIGVHIRRTDNRESIDHSPLELFEESMDNEIDRESNTNFYLATDCMQTKEYLKNKYGDKLRTNFMEVRRDTKEGVQQALVEMYSLARTKKVFGSYHSSFSDTACHIGSIKEITISNVPD